MNRMSKHMYKNLKAVYENGVLKPLGKVKFKEHQQVEILVLPDEAEALALAKAQRKALSEFCGIGNSGLPDLGSNHDKYLYPKD